MSNRVSLLFSVAEPNPGAIAQVERLIQQLNAARDWATGEVEFVNVRDAASMTHPDDEPIWTLGGVLWLDAPSNSPHERRQFEDVVFLFEELGRFSTLIGGDLVVEYNGEEVGAITDGQLDESLRVGLIREWERRLPSPHRG